jgi:uncharacterized protein (TIGR00369 family)
MIPDIVRSYRPGRIDGIAGVLKHLERLLPGAAPRLKKWFVEFGVPMNRAMGLRIDEVAPDSSRVAIRLPPRRRNMNVGGTIHGGVIAALAETAHGIAVLWQFDPAVHQMVTRDFRVEFLAPGRGALTVAFSLLDSARKRIEADLAQSGKCGIELTSEVKDMQGVTVARLTGNYVIRRRGCS